MTFTSSFRSNGTFHLTRCTNERREHPKYLYDKCAATPTTSVAVKTGVAGPPWRTQGDQLCRRPATRLSITFWNLGGLQGSCCKRMGEASEVSKSKATVHQALRPALPPEPWQLPAEQRVSMQQRSPQRPPAASTSE